MSDTLDLDALTPEPRRIKFDGNQIEVQPPTTADVLILGKIGKKIENANELEDEELEEVSKQLRDKIDKIVPALGGKFLTLGQQMALLEIVLDMAIPPDAKELEAKGITVDGPKDRPAS